MSTDRETTARAVATAALGVPGVAGLTGGRGAVLAATNFPGGRVVGVQLTPTSVWVHVVLGRLPLDSVADEVRLAVRAALDRLQDARVVEVVVDDIDESVLGGLPAIRGGLP